MSGHHLLLIVSGLVSEISYLDSIIVAFAHNDRVSEITLMVPHSLLGKTVVPDSFLGVCTTSTIPLVAWDPVS